MAADRPHGPKELLPLAILCVFVLLLLFRGGAEKIVFSAVLLSYILTPVVSALESRGIGRGIATFLVLGAIVGFIVMAGIFMVPTFLEQIRALQSSVTSAKASASIQEIQEGIRAYLQPLGLGNIDLFEKAGNAKRQFGERVFEFLVKDALALLVAGVAILFMMFFLMKDGRDLKKGFIELVPNRYFEFVMDLLYKMDVQLGNFLRSQFTDALVFGILSSLAMWILGVPYFLFIGAFAGLANLIPYVGPIAGVLPAFALSVLNSGTFSSGLHVIIAFIILKIIDDFLVQPFLISRGIGLHPLYVLVAILIGGGLFGILGMLLAAPAAGFLKVAFRESLVTYRKYRFS